MYANTVCYVMCLICYVGYVACVMFLWICLLPNETRGPWTLAFCLTAAVDMTGNFLQTCVKNSLLQTESIEIWTLNKIKGTSIKLGFIDHVDRWDSFQNCHIWTWNLANGKSFRSFTYTSSLFLPQPGGQNWTYFHSMGNGFQDTDIYILKLPYLGMNLGHWQKI